VDRSRERLASPLRRTSDHLNGCLGRSCSGRQAELPCACGTVYIRISIGGVTNEGSTPVAPAFQEFRVAFFPGNRSFLPSDVFARDGRTADSAPRLLGIVTANHGFSGGRGFEALNPRPLSSGGDSWPAARRSWRLGSADQHAKRRRGDTDSRQGDHSPPSTLSIRDVSACEGPLVLSGSVRWRPRRSHQSANQLANASRSLGSLGESGSPM
jgi:hypothetical protein